jgi:transcriptional/translational regulatory protein YebC/TACO1
MFRSFVAVIVSALCLGSAASAAVITDPVFVRGNQRSFNDFDHLGAIDATGPAGVDAETAAIEAGAQDLEAGDEGVTHFYTAPSDLDAVRKALEAAHWKVRSAALVWRAKNPVTVAPEHRAEVDAFLEELDEDDDVQTLFVGMK